MPRAKTTSKTSKNANHSGALNVNVASSRYTLDGFVNLDTSVYFWLTKLPRAVQDVLPAKYQTDLADYRKAAARGTLVMADCRKPLPFGDATVDHILSSHFLEHVYPDECQRILHDYFRALKPGGTLHIIVPDLRPYVDEYLKQAKAGDINAANWFMVQTILSRPTRGSWRYRLMEMTGLFGLQHRWMYDRPALENVVKAAGFRLEDGKGTASEDYGSGQHYYLHVFGRKE